METLDFLVGTLISFGKNTAYNLDFIPDDKLSWKPAPDANSALEVAQHIGLALTLLSRGIAGEEGGPVEIPVPANREEAKALVLETSETCAGKIRGLKPADFTRKVSLNGREFPMQRAAAIPLIDLLHHHGQIAYLQTMLGDKESHFDPRLF